MRLTVNLQIKKSKVRTDKKCPIYVRCTMDGKRIELSTGIFVSDLDWDGKFQTLNGRSEKVRILNNRLDKFVTNIYDVYNQIEAKGESFDVFCLKDKLTGVKTQNGIIKTFDKVISSIESKNRAGGILFW